jgi:hypothetical protein
MIKKRFISMLVLLMTAVTGAWATITVTWNNDDITGRGNSFTKDGVTITAGMIDFNFKNFLRGGTFTTDLGNFTKIEVTAQDFPQFSGTGWSGSNTKQTWTGNASSVSFSGAIRSMGKDINFVFTIEPPTVAVTGVTLAPTSATLTLGETETVTLIPTVLPAEATDKSVTWSSSNEAVATVTDGVVTAVAAGTATITVTTTDGAKTATCAVTVAAPAASTYTVTLKEGTEDATSWTIAPPEATTTGVAAGTTVTATYSGTKKVKSVKAVKKASASIPLDNTTTAWTAGTYAVPAGGLTYSAAITVSGDVTLTLTDGETLTLNKGISLAEGATLTIQGNGTMNVNGTDGNTSSTVGGNHGTLILTSGTLTATGGNGGNIGMSTDDSHGGNGGDAINGSVIVSGGTLTAWGGNGGSVDYMCYNCSGGNGGDAISGTLTINGGSTSVNDGSNGSIGSQCDYCTAGTGGKAVAGNVTDNR